jgi:hypothetical protein
MRHLIALSGLMAIAVAVGSDRVTATDEQLQSGFAANDWVQGSGRIAHEARDLAAFDTVLIDVTADVRLRKGTVTACTLVADDNLLPIIVTESEHGTLRIASEKSFSTRSGIQVELTTPQLQRLVVNGNGEVAVQGMDATSLAAESNGTGALIIEDAAIERLDLGVHGSGSVTGSGYTGQLDVQLTGAANIELAELRTQHARVRLEGSGNIAVHATHSFSAVLSGSGLIEVGGNPKTRESNITGAGAILYE